MTNIILAALLFFVSFLPASSQKTSLENKLKDKIARQTKVEQKSDVSLAKFEIRNIPEKNEKWQMSASAKSALFIDVSSGEILFEKEKDTRLSMASTTKLMTALVAIEKLNLNEVVTVPNFPVRPLDSVMGLAPGDKIKVSELLHGLLIESGADAAMTLSNRISGSENAFAALMNERALKLGLADTQFTNSVGYDATGHYSTTSDLSKLAKVVLSNKEVAQIVAKSAYTAKAENGKTYYLTNTNKLVGGTNYKGVKTGTTFSAGGCLVSLYDDGSRKIIGVVLASPERFSETQSIVNWTLKNFSW